MRALILILIGSAAGGLAQPPASPPASNAVAAAGLAYGPPLPPSFDSRGASLPVALPMPPPLPPAPLNFRELIAMSEAEREKVLAGRSPRDRQVIESKIKEYEELAPEEREMRLRALQLRLHLRPLMTVPPEKRVERLAAIPETDRETIVQRLKAWDELSPELQRQLLENELAINALVHPELALPRGRFALAVTPRQQAVIDDAIKRWKALPEQTRQQINYHFQVIFQLDEDEKAKCLQAVGEAERRQIESTLKIFRSLTGAQREAYIAGLRRFTELPREERNRFLRNAELWRKMSPEDRTLWRELLTRFRPPLPPLPPPPPPRLPHVPAQRSSTLATTNDEAPTPQQ